MKAVSLILNGVLLILVAHLYYLNFSSNSPAEEGAETTSGDAPAMTVKGGQPVTGRILFVNADSMAAQYGFLDYMTKQLETRRDGIDKDLKKENDRIMGLVKDFEDRARYFTSQTQYQVEADKIKKEEQKFEKYANRRAQELMDYETQLNDELAENVRGYLAELNQTLGADFIMNYSSIGGSLLICNDSLEITSMAVEGLNKKFEEKYGNKEEAAE